MDKYRFLSKLILRTPFYSFGQYSPEKLKRVLTDPCFQQALFLANPVLYQLLAEKLFNTDVLKAKEILSLLKYYNRMSFRPTPFGSFSAFSVVSWNEGPGIELDTANGNKLLVDADRDVSLQLAALIPVAAITEQVFHLNPAIYKLKDEFRFIRTVTTNDKGKHSYRFHLESLECNSLTEDIINFCSEKSYKGKDIISRIEQQTTCLPAEALSYLMFLTRSGILFTELSPTLLGKDYLQRLLDHRLSTDSDQKKSLKIIYNRLNQLKFPDTETLTGLSKELLEKLNTTIMPKQIFYSNLERQVLSGGLDNGYRQQLIDGLNCLRILADPVQPPALKQFIEQFKLRFEGRKIPLLLALDPEAGIDYADLARNQEHHTLLAELDFQASKTENHSILWSAVHQLLMRKWSIDQQKNSKNPVVLSAADLSGSDQNNIKASLPPTLAVMFRTINDEVFIESAGGASATALIGRFTRLSEEVLDIARQLASLEEQSNPDVIFAELGQLSDGHADNINRRNYIYTYEIPVNTISLLPPENQIRLNDLLLSVVNDQLVLESVSLNKIVIPRLSSAYNYHLNSLSVFRLLADLQHQGIQSQLSLNLEHYFPGLPFYPRLQYNKVILCPAKWILSAKDISDLTKIPGAIALQHLKKLREDLQLPHRIAITRFDQQLVFDLSKEGEAAFFLEILKGAGQIVIQEYFISETNKHTVKAADGQGLINQFIAFLHNPDVVYAPVVRREYITVKKREFELGSKWLYLKIYCAPSVSNKLLGKVLLPLINLFILRNEIQSCFFIRYSDPGYHIRLRLCVSEKNLGSVVARLRKKFAFYIENHIVREYRADVYRPELERYGEDIMDPVETVFKVSSMLVLNYIRKSITRRFKQPYHSLALRSVKELLEIFAPLPENQLAFLDRLVQAFYSEFSSDKTLKIGLDQKYRSMKNETSDILNDPAFFTKLKLENEAEYFYSEISKLAKLAETFSEERRWRLLADLIHMHLNRLFIQEPRKQELIIYYTLYKYKLSEKGKEKRSRA